MIQDIQLTTKGAENLTAESRERAIEFLEKTIEKMKIGEEVEVKAKRIYDDITKNFEIENKSKLFHMLRFHLFKIRDEYYQNKIKQN